MSKKLEGKVAVITGGNSGLGLATAELLAKEGAHVYITGRRQKELDAAVKKIGKNATGVQGDVTSMKDLDKLYAIIKKDKRKIDILFANAGFYETTELGKISEEQYDKLFDINVKGLLFTVQKALPLVNEGGSIILNASIVASKGVGAFSIYSATKAAVRSFARTWTTDLKSKKIRVNAISPGVIPTEGYSAFGSNDKEIKQFTNSMLDAIPLGHTGVPDDIAKAVLFLGSDDSKYITGIELFVDGGFAQV